MVWKEGLVGVETSRRLAVSTRGDADESKTVACSCGAVCEWRCGDGADGEARGAKRTRAA
jgi:hypothetical protein